MLPSMQPFSYVLHQLHPSFWAGCTVVFHRKYSLQECVQSSLRSFLLFNFKVVFEHFSSGFLKSALTNTGGLEFGTHTKKVPLLVLYC